MVEAALLPFDDGRIYLAYSAGERSSYTEGEIRIMGKWSHDAGESWSDPFLIRECPGKPNVMEPSFLRLPSGRILQAYMQRDGYLPAGERFGDLYPMVTWSDDECQTWAEPARITGEENLYFSTNDRLVPLSTGRIILPVLTAPAMTSVRAWRSDDEGRSWRCGAGAIHAAEGVTYGYPTAAELADGTVAMFLLNSTDSLHVAHSHDGGETWTVVTESGPTPCPATFMVRRVPDSSDLLLIWNNHTERTNLTSAISRDSGQTWGSYRLMEEQEDWPVSRTHAFPSLAFMNGRAHLTYYERLAHPQTGYLFHLIYARYPISWFYEPRTTRSPLRTESD